MRDAVIVEAVRTPVGRRGGGLSGVHPVDLSAHVLKALVERTGLDPAVVDDVIWGCVSQVGEQTFNVGRSAVLAAGWPESVPGVTVDRQCGSSQQSVHFAAAGLVSGQYDVVVAGGVESMSRVTLGSSAAGGRRSARRCSTATPTPWRRRHADLQPGRRCRAHRPALGPDARPARQVRARVARARGRGHGQRRLRGADRPGDAARRQRGGRRRGHPPGRDARGARRTQDAVRDGGVVTAGDLVADLGRRRGAADDDLGAAPRSSGLTPDGPDPHRGAGRRRPGHDAHRAHPGDAQGAATGPACRSRTSARSRSTRPSPRSRWPGWPRPAPTRSRSTRTAGRSRSGTRSAASGARLMTTLVAPPARHRDDVRPADHVRGRRSGQRDDPRTPVRRRYQPGPGSAIPGERRLRAFLHSGDNPCGPNDTRVIHPRVAAAQVSATGWRRRSRPG